MARPLAQHHAWKGGMSMSPQGYVLIATGHGNPKAEHVVLAELALGRALPLKVEIHHFDGDKTHNNGNLVICEDRAYHALLHARQRILSAGGDPNTQRLCCGCKRLLNNDQFFRDKSRYDGLCAYCKPCKMARNRRTEAKKRLNT